MARPKKTQLETALSQLEQDLTQALNLVEKLRQTPNLTRQAPTKLIQSQRFQALQNLIEHLPTLFKTLVKLAWLSPRPDNKSNKLLTRIFQHKVNKS